MMGNHYNVAPDTWRPQTRFLRKIDSIKQLVDFNDRGGIAVNIDVSRSTTPQIDLSGSQSETVSFWATRSESGFVTKPKFSAELLTIRFVTSGQFIYSGKSRDILGSPTCATLIGFENISEVRASNSVSAVSATIAVKTLTAANQALTGGDHQQLPPFAPVAEMSLPGMLALFRTVQLVQRQITSKDQQVDLVLPLVQEVMGYQLLSFWPKRINDNSESAQNPFSHRLSLAIDYIEENLSTVIKLSDVAGIVGISVRLLQDMFKKEVGQTPVQYIIDRRLQQVHQDLISASKASWSISSIARYWGFVHMNDFGQRYRRMYGCSPSHARKNSNRVR